MTTTGADAQDGARVDRVRFDVLNVAKATAAVVGAFCVAAVLTFAQRDGGAVVFTVPMAWFASIAMEPAVGRLARHMRRGAADGAPAPTAVGA